VPQTSRNYLELLNIFKAFLQEQAVKQGKTLVLLIDEAQTLKAPLLELLRQLMNYEANDQKFLQMVLFAQEEFRVRLHQPRYRNLVNRAAMASTLDALSPSDTEAMLRYRWTAAGGKDFPFTPEAIELLYRYSQGIPRTQVILADNALLGAFVSGTDSISGEMIEQVVADRGLPDTEPEPRPAQGRLSRRSATAAVRRSA
jgi:general secretion pathway protein A